ncbi:MAG TPA: sulfatase [Bacteroidales bacterium]|nr:sulfatase [Bacteroidales bacterium]
MKNQLTIGVGAMMLCFSAFAQKKALPSQPNILLFIADDCTFRDLGCYGGINVETPNIDRFAKEGMQFTRCFQAAPMSSPTRSCLYTGIYPVKSGAYPNHTFVKPGTKSIVQHLSPAGYLTALLGKTHISPKEAFPFNYLGDPGDELDFDKMDQFLAETIQKKQPFCLYVCSHQPHAPFTQGDPSKFDSEKIQLPPYFVDTKETRNEFVKYLAEINYMDLEFEKCLELLDKYGLSENTIVIFTSEQGNQFPFAKWTCYGNGLQTGFLVRWPGIIKPGSKSDAMIEYVDVAPTIIEIAGLKVPEVIEGKSFFPVLIGKKNTHKNYVYGIQTTRGIISGSDFYGIRTVRSESYRYILNLTPEATFNNIVTNSVGTGGTFYRSWIAKADTDYFAKNLVYKFQHRPGEELYDIVNDPLEMNNIAYNPQYSKIKKELKSRLSKWMIQQGDKGQQTEMEAIEHQVKSQIK